MKAVAFLGGGRITAVLLAGLLRAGHRGRLVVHDRHAGKLRRLERRFGVVGEANLHRAVAAAHLLVVAVRPASVPELLRAIGPLKRPVLAVSLAAGVPLTRLRAQLGPPARWARAMPSPACRTGRGLTALAFHRDMPRASRAEVRRLFASVGPVLEIAERKFDAFTVTYSVSHGYHALAGLASAAAKLGLDRAIALEAAAHALADGIICWREEKVPLANLLKEAATPGGIAATVMARLDEAGYPRILEQALRAGMARERGYSK